MPSWFAEPAVMVLLAALTCLVGGIVVYRALRYLPRSNAENMALLQQDLKARSTSSVDLIQEADEARFAELEAQMREKEEAAVAQSEAAARAVAAQQALAAAASAEVLQLKAFCEKSATASEAARREIEEHVAALANKDAQLAEQARRIADLEATSKATKDADILLDVAAAASAQAAPVPPAASRVTAMEEEDSAALGTATDAQLAEPEATSKTTKDEDVSQVAAAAPTSNVAAMEEDSAASGAAVDAQLAEPEATSKATKDEDVSLDLAAAAPAPAAPVPSEASDMAAIEGDGATLGAAADQLTEPLLAQSTTQVEEH